MKKAARGGTSLELKIDQKTEMSERWLGRTARMLCARAIALALCFMALPAALVPAASALAQQYPNRPIRVVVPGPPGTLTDVILGAIQLALEQKFGQRILLEHRPGAGGIIGTQVIAVVSPERLTGLSDTPTFKESGLPELQAAMPTTWWGLAAPINTDQGIVRRWSTEFQEPCVIRWHASATRALA